jgi:NitT/TauT family transport system substrate-binding protein
MQPLHQRISRGRLLALASAPLAAAGLPLRLAAQTATVRISTTLSEAFAEPLYGNDLGFYKRAGLNVEVTQYSGGQTSETAVVTGNADIGVTTPIQLANAVVHGIPLRLIGFCGMYSSSVPQPALFVAKDSTIRDAKGLEGKTVGVNALGTMNFLGIQAWLTQNGADVTKVKAVEVPFAEIAAALGRGTIDAGVMGEPFITNGKDKVRMLAPAFDVMGQVWAVSVWFSSIEYIRRNPALIKRSMDVAYQIAKYVNPRPEVVNPILMKYSKLSAETVNAMMHTPFAEAADPNTCRRPLEFAYRYKILSRPVTVEEMMSTAT